MRLRRSRELSRLLLVRRQRRRRCWEIRMELRCRGRMMRRRRGGGCCRISARRARWCSCSCVSCSLLTISLRGWRRCKLLWSGRLSMSEGLLLTKSTRSWVTYFFKRKFDLSEGTLGTIFSITGVISALSIFVASSISKRIGNVKVKLPTYSPFPPLQSQAKNCETNAFPTDNGLHPPPLRNLSRPHPLPLHPPRRPHLPHRPRLHPSHGRGAPFRLLSGNRVAQ